ncbi:hypothetical protein D3C72_1537380 [compost metagenome]
MWAGRFQGHQATTNFQAGLNAPAHVDRNIPLDQIGVGAVGGQLVANLQGNCPNLGLGLGLLQHKSVLGVGNALGGGLRNDDGVNGWVGF